MSDTEHVDHGPGIRVHPPLIFGSSILCGMGLNHLHAIPIPGIEDGRIAGGILISIAIAIAFWALIGFYRADTDVPNLFGRDGLPVSLFRTDHPVVRVGKRKP